MILMGTRLWRWRPPSSPGEEEQRDAVVAMAALVKKNGKTLQQVADIYKRLRLDSSSGQKPRPLLLVGAVSSWWAFAIFGPKFFVVPVVNVIRSEDYVNYGEGRSFHSWKRFLTALVYYVLQSASEAPVLWCIPAWYRIKRELTGDKSSKYSYRR